MILLKRSKISKLLNLLVLVTALASMCNSYAAAPGDDFDRGSGGSSSSDSGGGSAVGDTIVDEGGSGSGGSKDNYIYLMPSCVSITACAASCSLNHGGGHTSACGHRIDGDWHGGDGGRYYDDHWDSAWRQCNSRYSACSEISCQTNYNEYRACERYERDWENGRGRGNGRGNGRRNGEDCIHCGSQSTYAENVSAWMNPIAYIATGLGSAYLGYKGQKAWANAYASGFDQCTSRFNSYLDYNITRGSNPILPEQAEKLMQCNGSPYGMYAGMGGLSGNGYGSVGNPYLAAGYSPAFMGAMIGPYGYGAGMHGGAHAGAGLHISLGGHLGAGYGAGMGGHLGGGYGAGMGGHLGGGYGAGMGGHLGVHLGGGYGVGGGLGGGYGLGGGPVVGGGMYAGGAGLGSPGGYYTGPNGGFYGGGWNGAGNGGYWGNSGGWGGNQFWQNQQSAMYQQQMQWQSRNQFANQRNMGNYMAGQAAGNALARNYVQAGNSYGLGMQNMGASGFYGAAPYQMGAGMQGGMSYGINYGFGY